MHRPLRLPLRLGASVCEAQASSLVICSLWLHLRRQQQVQSAEAGNTSLYIRFRSHPSIFKKRLPERLCVAAPRLDGSL